MLLPEERPMPALQSSAMTYARYRPGAEELDITFISGETYTYFGVPMGVYVGLVEAESAGSFYNDHIRDQYAFRKQARLHRAS
jgi:hypothetical protein